MKKLFIFLMLITLQISAMQKVTGFKSVNGCYVEEQTGHTVEILIKNNNFLKLKALIAPGIFSSKLSLNIEENKATKMDLTYFYKFGLKDEVVDENLSNLRRFVAIKELSAQDIQELCLFIKLSQNTLRKFIQHHPEINTPDETVWEDIPNFTSSWWPYFKVWPF